MQTIKLEFGFWPLTAYTSNSYAIDICYSNEKSVNWIYSNLINVTAAKDVTQSNARYNILCGDCYGGVEQLKYGYNMIDNENEDILVKIYHALRDSKYVFMYLDFYYLQGRCHKKHNILVNGIDFRNKKIMVVGYKVPFVFCQFEITFGKFRKAYNSKFNNSTVFIEISHIQKYECIQKSIIKTQVDDYINSRISFEKIEDYFGKSNIKDYNNESYVDFFVKTRNNNDYYYGFDCYKAIIEYINLYKNTNYLDIRPYKCMLEHKVIMKNRLQYFQHNLIFDKNWDFMFKLSEDIEDIAKRTFLLILKEKNKNDFSGITHIIDNIYSIESKELALFEKLQNAINS